jgi:hypothetical protein
MFHLSTYTITINITPHDISTSLRYLLKVTHIYVYSLTLSHICTDHLIYRILPQIFKPLSLFCTILSSFWLRSSFSFHFSCQDSNLPIHVPADKHQAVAFLYCLSVCNSNPPLHCWSSADVCLHSTFRWNILVLHPSLDNVMEK